MTGMSFPPMLIERVTCCVCGGTGRVRRALAFERDCNVCDGEGKRPILMPAIASITVKDDLRLSATLGIPL